jgi:hypothetical protein
MYKIKKNALQQELTQLAPQELVARERVMNELKLLEEKHAQDQRMIFVQNSEIMNSYYAQLGIKSSMTLMRERDLAKDAYAAIAHSGTASYGQILQAQIKVLQAQIALDAAEGKNVTKEQAALDKLVATYNKWAIAIGHVNQAGRLQETVLRNLGVDAKLMGSTIQNVALGATAALGKMFEAWSQGGVTVAQACEQITAAILQSLAQYAFAKAVEQMALGFAALSPTSPDFGHSGEHFASAALWFAAGAATSIVAGAVSGAASGGSSSGSSSSAGSSNSLATPGSNATTPAPIQSVNIQHFASGALVSRRTLAMIGDSANGGDATEAALPLDDPKAMKTVGTAIASQMGGSGGGVVMNFAGLISPDNLTKVIKQINRKIERGGGKLVASNSLRVTKRSV